ncbi:hypothetical protein [Streptomyces sp. NPDC059874]|uniref:hypothetical protein n=1 Tax=Streptomyces sp. NPDC059874 TaxID=3346983 RepID=UPI0036557EC3
MSWSFILQITDCASGRPVDGATVHVKGYYEYEDQVPAESWTAIADGQGRLAIEAMDSVIVVDALVGKAGYVAGLLRVEPDAEGDVVRKCLQPAAASSGTRRPEALRVTGWGEAHVDIEWWNPEPYREILVGWSDATVSTLRPLLRSTQRPGEWSATSPLWINARISPTGPADDARPPAPAARRCLGPECGRHPSAACRGAAANHLNR